jgi:hypothetical protein
MIRRVLLILAFTLSASSAVAQQSPAVDDLLKRLEALGVEAAQLRTPPAVIIHVAPTESLQAAITAAPSGATIVLDAGAVYKQSATIPKTVTGLTITTDHCALGDRAALPSDLPVMATIQGTTGYALWVLGSQTTIRCLSIGPNPNGAGELIRVGDATSDVLADVPDGDVIAQTYLHGDPGAVFGQKRAISANGSHLLIDQNYADNIWVAGQDSQCVAVFSTPGPITIRRNIFGCASENILIGGTPPMGPAFIPSDILVEDNVLYKPLAWKGASPAHVIKNLFEVKFGRRITVRHNWMENHWQQAQPGPAIVLTLATNGPCGYCDMQDVTFEDNVVWNVSAGLSLTGYEYSYAPGAGQAVRFVIRNNLFVISKAAMGGTGRPLILSNEPKEVTVDHNTFLHDGTAIVAGDYGKKWPLQDPPLTAAIAAGPVQGFQFTHNLTSHGSYGFFTPDGSSGTQLGLYLPGAIIGGNVLAGASSAALARYNTFAGAVGPNVGGVLSLNADGCQVDLSAGADCARLPFTLRALVPR